MGSSKKDNMSQITRIISSQDNILGGAFDHKNNRDDNTEVIEWDFPNIDKNRIRTSKEKVLEQVLYKLESVNQSFGTNYIYSVIVATLIRHYHSENEFKEV